MSKLLKHSTLPMPPTREDKQDWVLVPHGTHNGMWMPMHIFSQYEEVTITNSTLELTTQGAGVGSPTLAADHFSYQGKVVESMTMGYWSKNTASTLTVRIRMTSGDTAMEWQPALPVTFQDIGNTVTMASHGFLAGKEVQLASIVSTTGIVINTTYYVITPIANTFQLSLTLGGAAINLVTDGTGTLRSSTEIHKKFFTSARLGINSKGHFEVNSMTTAVTIGQYGTVNMHGNISFFEGDSAEILGLHSENLALTVDTTLKITLSVTAQWSVAAANNQIHATNFTVM